MKPKQHQSIVEFYSSLNKSWVSSAIDEEIDNLPLNRTKRRDLKKSKNIVKKLIPIIYVDSSRKNFAENIYSHYKDKNPLDGIIDYDKIINSFNAENADMYTAYMLHICFSVEGYYENFFKKFILSEQFMNTIHNRWSKQKKEISADAELNDKSAEQIKIIEENNTNIPENTKTQEENLNKTEDFSDDISQSENINNTDIIPKNDTSPFDDLTDLEQIEFSDDCFVHTGGTEVQTKNDIKDSVEISIENNIEKNSENIDVSENQLSADVKSDTALEAEISNIENKDNTLPESVSHDITSDENTEPLIVKKTEETSYTEENKKSEESAEKSIPETDSENFVTETAELDLNQINETPDINAEDTVTAPVKNAINEVTVLNTEENSISSASDDKESITTAKTEVKSEIIIPKPKKPRYLGFISMMNTFYNFYPQYLLKDNTAYMVDNPEYEFPEKRNVNLFYVKNSAANDFLQKNYDANSAIVIEFDRKEMEPNYKPGTREVNQTNYKLDTERLVQNGLIKQAYEYNAYRVVTPKHSVNFYGSISVKEYCRNGEKVFMRYKDKYYGPCTAERLGNLTLINFDIKNSSHMIKYYSDNERHKKFDLLSLELNDYYRYIYIFSGSKPNSEDVITDEILLDEFRCLIKRTHNKTKIDLTDVNNLASDNNNSPFLRKCPEEIRKARFERLSTILKKRIQFESDSSDILIDWVRHDFDSLKPIFDAAISPTAENVIYYTLREQNDRLADEVKTLRDENEELTKLQAEQNSGILFERELERRIRRKTDELDALTNRYENLKHIADINDEIIEKEDLIKQYRKKAAAENERLLGIREQIGNLSSDVTNAINKARDAASIAFEPIIANKLLKSAAEWENDNYENKLAQTVSTINSIKPDVMSSNELIEYICRSVQGYRRHYSDNSILNIVICMTQGFLTVFSGEPGIGKTSICNIMAKVLGLTQFSRQLSSKRDCIAIDRYIPVAVEKGWTSKRDFIGYYNPLTKKFDAANNDIYQGFRILDKEIVDNIDISKYPFVMLLDEANLSQMEYYWADFMNMADSDSRSVMKLNLGAGITVKIPKTFRFVATINNDQTSEVMSPRLLDRAWMISLPEVEFDEYDDFSERNSPSKIISWDNLNNTFGETAGIGRHTENEEILKKFYTCFEKYGVHVSFRTKKAINSYVKTAQAVFLDEGKRSKNLIAIDYAITQRLLPKLNTYTNKKLLHEIDTLCKSSKDIKQLDMTAKYVAGMLKNAEYNDIAMFS